MSCGELPTCFRYCVKFGSMPQWTKPSARPRVPWTQRLAGEGLVKLSQLSALIFFPVHREPVCDFGVPP